MVRLSRRERADLQAPVTRSRARRTAEPTSPFARLPDEVVRAVLNELLVEDGGFFDATADDVRSNVLMLRDIALVDRRLARVASTMARERFVIGPSNEAGVLAEIPERLATVRNLYAGPLGPEAQATLAQQLHSFSALRCLVWDLIDNTLVLRLPSSLQFLMLADQKSSRHIGVTFSSEPCGLHTLIIAKPVSGAAAPFRHLRCFMCSVAHVQDGIHYQRIVAVATSLRTLVLCAEAVDAAAAVLGDEFAAGHATLRQFIFAVTAVDGGDLADMLGRLPDGLDELTVRAQSESHVEQIRTLDRLVGSIRVAWSDQATAERMPRQLTSLVADEIAPCGPVCQAPALGAELAELCRNRSPAVQLELS